MSSGGASWVAGTVRGRLLLLDRTVGPAGAKQIAAAGTLDGALALLAATPYGHDASPGMDLVAAERAIAATVLWHLRVLAGWLPQAGGQVIRLLAGWFELANIDDRLTVLAGGRAPSPFVLGSLGTAWRAVSSATTPAGVRDAVAASAWGDPGTADAQGIHLALRLAWARRVARGIPEAAAFAEAAAALVLSREMAARRECPWLPEQLVPTAWRGALSIEELAARLPRDVAWALADVHTGADVWAAEQRWWERLDLAVTQSMAAAGMDRGTVAAVAARLLIDAVNVRNAVVRCAQGGDGTGNAVA